MRAMKTQIYPIIVFFAFTLVYAGPALAAYEYLGTGTIGGDTSGQEYALVYDDVNDITWFDYTPEMNDFPTQEIWADILVVNFGSSVIDDWRLPEISEYSFDIISADPFTNVLASMYWSQTEVPPEPDQQGRILNYFNFEDGSTGTMGGQRQSMYALAVTPGRASSVPLPAALYLLGSGLLGLAGLRRKIKK
jgi:hypothetical protein